MMRKIIRIILVLVLAGAFVDAEVMVQWGVPGGESGIVTNHTTTGSVLPWVWNVTNVVSTVIGDNGYYTNSAGRTPTVYGACSENPSGGGSIGFAVRNFNPDAFWVRGYLDSNATHSAMIVWKEGDYLTSGRMIVTNFTIEMQQNSSGCTGVMHWVIASSGQWYISQESREIVSGYPVYDVAAATLSWNEFTPFGNGTNGPGVATTGNPSSITLNSVSFVGIYNTVVRTNGSAQSGINVRYFAVQGIAPPSSTVIMIL